MIRSEAVAIIVRRLGLNPGRVAALVQRCADAGLLPKANGRAIPDLGSLELSRVFMAAVCDLGLGNAATAVTTFSGLRTDNGVVLGDVIEALIAGRAEAGNLRHLVLQLDPAGALLNGAHNLVFGAPLSTAGAARHVIITGDALSAICFEFQGHSPEQADNAIAVGRLAAALN
jgi:hypothetical protein